MKRKNDLDLKELPSIIEEAGGSRVQLKDHINDPSRAGTLSEVLEKIKNKGGSVAKMVNNPVAKKGLAVLGGPVIGAAMTAQDALASEDVGAGSDEFDPYSMTEDYRQDEPAEQIEDTNLSPEQNRRWNKVKQLINK